MPCSVLRAECRVLSAECWVLMLSADAKSALQEQM